MVIVDDNTMVYLLKREVECHTTMLLAEFVLFVVNVAISVCNMHYIDMIRLVMNNLRIPWT